MNLKTPDRDHFGRRARRAHEMPYLRDEAGILRLDLEGIACDLQP